MAVMTWSSFISGNPWGPFVDRLLLGFSLVVVSLVSCVCFVRYRYTLEFSNVGGVLNTCMKFKLASIPSNISISAWVAFENASLPWILSWPVSAHWDSP